MSKREVDAEDLPSAPQHQTIGNDGKHDRDQETIPQSYCKQGTQSEDKSESKSESTSYSTCIVKTESESEPGDNALISASHAQSLKTQVERDDIQTSTECDPAKNSCSSKCDTSTSDSLEPRPVRARKKLLKASLPSESHSPPKRVKNLKSERETLAVKLLRTNLASAREGEPRPLQQGESSFEYDMNGIQIPRLYQNTALDSEADLLRTHHDWGREGTTAAGALTVVPSSLEVYTTSDSSVKPVVRPQVEAYPVRMFPNYHLAQDELVRRLPLDLTRHTSTSPPADLTLKPLDLTQHSTTASGLTTVPPDTTKQNSTRPSDWTFQPDCVSAKTGSVLKCRTCSATFSSRHNLRIHAQIHMGEKPFKCEQCPAAFSRVSSLKDHHKTHTGEKPHVCMLCGSAFSKMSSLKDHTRIHTGEKPYRCEFCSAAFSQQTSLKKHTRTHTGEKPYKCDQCDAAFTQQTNLKTHLRIHSGEKPYKCEFCDSAFSQLAGLKKHGKTHITGRQSRDSIQCHSACPITGEALQV